MKKFSFPLDQVLSWRQTQARLEEANLARLTTELGDLDLRTAALSRSVDQARGSLITAASVTPAEIGAMEHYRASAAAQVRHLVQSRRALEQKIALQMQNVVERRRDAHLLARLRERRLEAWRLASHREIEQQAEESFLARLARNPHFPGPLQ